MIVDYALTKWGMSIGVVTEGNVLMQWLMNLPFIYGITVKAVISIVLITPLYLAKKLGRRIYTGAMCVAFCAYTVVMFMHLFWIYVYFA